MKKNNQGEENPSEKREPEDVAGKSKLTLVDKAIIRQCEDDKKGGSQFRALYRYGDISCANNDDSQAERMLIRIIATYSGYNLQQIERIFQHSKLWRSELHQWNTDQGISLCELTIRKVLDGRPIKSDKEVEDYLDYKHEFRFNEVLGRTEMMQKMRGTLLDDFQLNSIYRDLQNNGSKMAFFKLKSLLHSDFVDTYNPFVEYFGGLPDWDGTDWIGKLSGTVQAHDQQYGEWTLRKWIVGLVGCALSDDVVNHQLLIFIGGQGIGKTSWFKTLLPNPLRNYEYSGELNPSDKDTLIHISECLLVNLDELSSLTKRKESELKELITKGDIRIRRPYGHFAENLVRRASLCGSINEDSFLQDPTGSRRFLINRAHTINYQHEIPIDKVYAQALHLFKDGFQYWFDMDDIRKIHAHNKSFEIQTVEEELLLERYIPALKVDKNAKRLTTVQVLQNLYEDSNKKISHGEKIRMGRALKKHGFKQMTRDGYSVWLLKWKK